MRIDRRTALGAALTAMALVAFAVVTDLAGVASGVADWLAVARPIAGDAATLAGRLPARAEHVHRLAGVLDRDPFLSGALVLVGVGAGLIAGSLGAFVHQRRRLRRGVRDE